MHIPSEQNLKVCRRDEKVWWPEGQTNERTAEVLYTPIFLCGGMQILSKINFRNFKKIYISCKSTFFPFDPFSYKKKPNHPLSKKISGINKIWYGTYFYTPRYPAGGRYIVYVRHCLCNSSLTTWWNWMNLTGNL